MLNANSKDKADAWALIKVLGGKDFVALDDNLEGVNPPRKDVADLPEFKNDWWQQAFTAQLPTGVALAPINWGLVVNDITDAMQKVIYKTKSPEDAAKELYNALGQRAQNNQL
jgi:maltose-binding protein MalE